MFENIVNFFKKLGKNEKEDSRTTAKERLHLVLMQDRANVSADFLELMKQEMIVKIEQEDKPSPGGGTPGGNPGSGGSKSPSGGANVTAEGGNDTTVNNTNINQGKSGGGNNNSSSVDIDALASAIANKMAAVLDARNIGS